MVVKRSPEPDAVSFISYIDLTKKSKTPSYLPPEPKDARLAL
jgi:hypothetical protein